MVEIPSSATSRDLVKNASPADAKLLRWGILGTGAIARQFAAALSRSKWGKLVAVASREPRTATIEEFGQVPVGKGYDSLLQDGDVDAVYIATPHPSHAELAIRAVEAGKHVLCEKPIGMNAAEAAGIADAARSCGVTVMEAFMYRGHPQTLKLVELLEAGTIGKISLIQANYGYRTAFDPRKRHFDPELGGGAILDVGCYCVSAARLVAGIAAGRPFAEPLEVKAVAAFSETGVDERTGCVMRFPQDIVAQATVSITTVQEPRLLIHGTEGMIDVRSPWFCSGKEGGTSEIVVRRPTGDEVHRIECGEWLYALEADLFAESVRAGSIPWPAPSLDDTIGNMRALDAWRRDIGLTYPSEEPTRRVTVAGRPLARKAAVPMPFEERLGLDKKASKLAIGGMMLKTFPDASLVYDAFFEAGGTVFDSAYVYGQGLMDRLLGQWMKSRGVRHDVIVIAKGAHTPHCRPDAIAPQLDESLDRMQTDHADLYFLHRDDPSIPVGEFVDVLDGLRRAGRIGRFGGSNWTIGRIEEANAYARDNDKFAFELLSNNFSLAEMVAPMWAGCISSSDVDSAAWLERTQTPLFAWSSQARGFFTDRGGRDKLDDKTLVESWYSETNFRRRDRVHELAARLGASPAQVALAYLLAQPFPIFPIIGPSTLAELRDSMGAAEVRLTPDDAAWLREGASAS